MGFENLALYIVVTEGARRGERKDARRPGEGKGTQS